MNKEIVIENQKFIFGEDWTVIYYDEEKGFKKLKDTVDGTKDVDIIALDNQQRLFLMEITDLRGHGIQNREKIRTGEMVLEIAQKVRDTIPSLISANIHSPIIDKWKPFIKALINREEPIRVIFWLEEDRHIPPPQEKRRKNEKNIFMDNLKRKLKWLTSRVLVVDQGTYEKCIPEIQVYNISHDK